MTGGPAAAEERAAAAGLGRRSAHPVARAVAAHLAGPAATPTEVRELPGHGDRGTGRRPAGAARARRLGRRDRVGTARVGDGHGLRLRGRSGFDVLASPRCCGPARGRRWMRCAPTGSTSRSSRATRRGRSAASRGELGIGELPLRAAAGRQDRPSRSAARRRAPGADGRRRAERHGGAGGGGRVDGAGLGRRRRTPGRRLRLHPRPARRGGGGARDRPGHGAGGAAELRLRGGLQLPRDPARGRGLRHAADRGARDVGIVDPGRRQRAAAQRPGSRLRRAARRPRAFAGAPA